MTYKEYLKRKLIYNIVVDFNEEIIYGSNQANVNYPVRFPTVEFELLITDGLKNAIENLRTNNRIAVEEDPGCWYNAYVGINSFTSTKLDSCITAVVVNSNQKDDEHTYTIDLDEDMQEMIYAVLDAQCREKLGKSCHELLEEAQKHLMEEKGDG